MPHSFPEAATPASHRLKAGGVEFHYMEAGSGPLLLFLHGFPEFWYSWRRQIPAVAAAGFRAAAVDLPGYNESSKPRGADAYRITTITEQVGALISELGAPCVVVGHDWGGVIAWLLAMMRPELLRKLIVINMPHPAALSRELQQSVRQRLALSYQLLFQPALIPEVLMPIFLPQLMRRSGRFTREELGVYKRAWKKKGVSHGMANYYRALWRHPGDMQRFMRKIAIPTLLIWGEKDPVFRRKTSEDFDEWVTDLRIARIADAGHFVQTDEPEIVNDLIIDFAR